MELRDWGEDWYLNLGSTRPLHIASSRYDGYYARKQAHVHKLAMILAVAERSDMTLTVTDVKKAAAMMDAAEHSLNRVFEAVGMIDEAKRSAELISYVRAHKRLTSQQLWYFVRNVMNQKEFNEACQAAYRSGQLTHVQDGGQLYWILPSAASPRVVNAP
jgi:hypothetical protein